MDTLTNTSENPNSSLTSAHTSPASDLTNDEKFNPLAPLSLALTNNITTPLFSPNEYYYTSLKRCFLMKNEPCFLTLAVHLRFRRRNSTKIGGFWSQIYGHCITFANI